MTLQPTIKQLSSSQPVCDALSSLLIAVVADGGSVSFMHPLALADAETFWQTSFAAADRGERVILAAFVGNELAGTVTLLLNCPPNQPHRAEIAKLMTSPSHRRKGIAKLLLQAAEQIAIERGRTLLVLDTAADGGAARIYEGQGYTLTGIIPDYALKPHGGLTDTMIYWKKVF